MSDDDLRYEDLDDDSYPEDELESINLDALDDAIEPEPEPDASTKEILETITTLDDEIEPVTAAPEAAAPQEAPPEAKQDDGIKPAKPKTRQKPEKVETPTAPSPLDLDGLDDAIEPEAKPDQKTEAFLETITTLDDEIEPVTAAPEAPAREETQPEAAVPPAEEPAAPPDVEPQEAPPDWIYRVLLAVPTEMSAEMVKLRELSTITDMPEPGFELVAPFRSAHPEAMQAALRSWARNHLPLQLEVTGVQADVIGAHDYVASWTLLPGDDLDEAQADLLRALAAQVTFVPEAPEKPPLRVIVGQKVAPAPFPRLVARMQRDFKPYVWHAETATLVRQEAGSTTWETVDSYR